MILKVDNLSKVYRVYDKRLFFRNIFSTKQKPTKEILALKNISFTLNSGDILGIIGPNGSGKTTLLKILSGITYFDEGEISGNGKILPLLEIGGSFNPNLSVEENIFIAGNMLGINDDLINSSIDDMLNWADISEFKNLNITRLSKGMFSKLYISMMFYFKARVMLIDEILSVVDIAFKQKCYEKIIEQSTLGNSFIIVSHDMDLIKTICNKVIFLKSGEILDSGEPDDVVTEYEQAAVRGYFTKNLNFDLSLNENEFCKINNIILKNQKKEIIERFVSDNENFLDISYNIKKNNLNTQINADFYVNGILITGYRSMPFKIPKKGMCLHRLHLPKNFFYSGSLDISISIKNQLEGQWITAKIDKALSFSINKSQSIYDEEIYIKSGLKTPKTWLAESKITGEKLEAPIDF